MACFLEARKQVGIQRCLRLLKISYHCLLVTVVFMCNDLCICMYLRFSINHVDFLCKCPLFFFFFLFDYLSLLSLMPSLSALMLANYSQACSGKCIKKQGIRGDMQKIRVIRQSFKASGPLGHFFEKTKKNIFR